ncbi:MAG: alpha/beta fold hydrolase [Candidatus Binatus sp.]|uniref:alpha/beta hydrolase n=1 Tax=Candidatus Binatus sp. TaxID=2811406 RepID=UPI002717EEC3|nr:alpha/beta fold hydrolase [Candidatus Binatus sp.]MDO8432027.1 alpha/beta fold hydrolase [Candidatus Binatus sp.]
MSIRIVAASTLFAIIMIVAAGCSSSAGYSTQAAAATPVPSPTPASLAGYAQPDLGGEHVSFTTSDGVLLRGHLYGRGATGVILAHMYPADQSDWTDFAKVLADHGYQALTFDFRGFTESEGRSGTEFADRDLLAAYEFMRPRVPTIFFAGASLGAEAAILVAVGNPVAGVICISVPSSFGGLDVSQAVREVKAPILFVTSTGDALVAGQPEILYKSAKAPKSFQSLPGSAHGTAILHGPHSQELQSLMLRFIAANQPHASANEDRQ